MIVGRCIDKGVIFCYIGWDSILQARTIVELQNRDGYPTVYIHLDNLKSDRSVSMPNGTQFALFGSEGDGSKKSPQWVSFTIKKA